MPNANNQNTQQNAGLQYGSGVGNIMASTLPAFGLGTPSNSGNAAPSQATASTGVYNGPLASMSFLSEPFAVWLGMILLLVILKYASEHKSSSLNPAQIKIGGYNFMVIGVNAAIFLTIFKVLFNRVKVPGVTEFANAL